MTLAPSALVHIGTVATLGGTVKWGLGLLAALLIIVPVRLLGRFLIRQGSAMERAKHGVLPGAGSAPPGDGPVAPAEPERYDPFDAG